MLLLVDDDEKNKRKKKKEMHAVTHRTKGINMSTNLATCRSSKKKRIIQSRPSWEFCTYFSAIYLVTDTAHNLI